MSIPTWEMIFFKKSSCIGLNSEKNVLKTVLEKNSIDFGGNREG